MGLRTHALVSAAAIVVMSFTALPTTSAAPAPVSGQPSQPCAVMGPRLPAGGREVLTCTRFHGSGAAVRLPSSSATVAYGLVTVYPGGDATFTSTDGTLPVEAGAAQRVSADMDTTVRAYFRATVSGGVVTALRPWLVITDAAVLAPFAGHDLTGRAHTLGAPSGVPASMWLRIAFGATGARARVVNYSQGVRAHGACRSALMGAATSSFVRRTLGAHGEFTVVWFPAMHAPGDSEIVLMGSRGASYMSPGPHLEHLLTGTWSPSTADFGIHGNPIGTVATLAGRLGDRHALVRC